MSHVQPGRFSAEINDEGVVVFLIGMRINSLWRITKWLPVFIVMPKMIAELMRDPSLGLLSRPRTFVSGKTVLLVQYWSNFEALESYARSSEREHLPAWRLFNKRVRNNGAVGIWHETYRVARGDVETVYANMPKFGLALATNLVPASKLGNSAGRRIGVRDSDDTAVAPY